MCNVDYFLNDFVLHVDIVTMVTETVTQTKGRLGTVHYLSEGGGGGGGGLGDFRGNLKFWPLK